MISGCFRSIDFLLWRTSLPPSLLEVTLLRASRDAFGRGKCFIGRELLIV